VDAADSRGGRASNSFLSLRKMFVLMAFLWIIFTTISTATRGFADKDNLRFAAVFLKLSLCQNRIRLASSARRLQTAKKFWLCQKSESYTLSTRKYIFKNIYLNQQSQSLQKFTAALSSHSLERIRKELVSKFTILIRCLSNVT